MVDKTVVKQNIAVLLPDNNQELITPDAARRALDQNTEFASEGKELATMANEMGSANAQAITDVVGDVNTLKPIVASNTNKVDDTITDLSDTKTKLAALTARVPTNPANDADLTELEEMLAEQARKDIAQDGVIEGQATRITAVELKDTAQDTAIEGLDTRLGTAEGTINDHNTAIGNNLASTMTNTAGISGLDTRLGTAEGKIDALETGTVDLSPVTDRLDTNETDIDTLETNQGALTTRVGTAETDIDTLQTNESTQNDTISNLDLDIKAAKQHNDEQDTKISDLETRIQEDLFDASDLRTAHGETESFTPDIAYRGTGDEAYFAANQATIPGLILNQASGSFTIPAINLTADDGEAIPSGTRIKLSNAYLNPGLEGTTRGFNPIFYFQVTQNTNVLLGAGNAGDDTNLERDWVSADSVDSFTILNTDQAVTGSAISVRWVAVYNGEDATLRPRLSGFTVSFTGQYEPLVEEIVHGVVDGEIDKLKDSDRLLEGSLAAQAVKTNQIEGNVESNTGLINGVLTRLNTDQHQVIEEASVIPVDIETLDATSLNTTIGGGTAGFKELDGEVDTETQFTQRFTDPTKTLFLGSGRIAHVVNGRFIILELVPQQDARTDVSETRYITAPDGRGTRTNPFVLEFGVIAPGSTTPQPNDSEVYLTNGIPTAQSNQTISNVSMAFGVRTNGNWNGVSDTLQFDIRSGETRSFQVPRVQGITFTATALANGQIFARATHDGGGDPQALATNGGAIRFDAGYTITTEVAEVARGQRSVDAGAFTGNEIITVDTKQVGDNGAETATIITPTATYDTGYFLTDASRKSFATDNDSFNVFASEASINITPETLAMLDGTDRYLGLFARTNHHGDALQLIKGLVVPNSEGTDNYNVGDTLKMLQDIPRGTGLTANEARSLAREEITNSPAIQANTAKAGVSQELLSRVTANDAKPTTSDVNALISAIDIPDAYDDTALSERVTTAQTTADSKTTPEQAKGQATEAITEALSDGGDIKTAIDNIDEYDDTELKGRVATLETDKTTQDIAIALNTAKPTNEDIINEFTVPMDAFAGTDRIEAIDAVPPTAEVPEQFTTTTITGSVSPNPGTIDDTINNFDIVRPATVVPGTSLGTPDTWTLNVAWQTTVRNVDWQLRYADNFGLIGSGTISGGSGSTGFNSIDPTRQVRFRFLSNTNSGDVTFNAPVYTRRRKTANAIPATEGSPFIPAVPAVPPRDAVEAGIFYEPIANIVNSIGADKLLTITGTDTGADGVISMNPLVITDPSGGEIPTEGTAEIDAVFRLTATAPFTWDGLVNDFEPTNPNQIKPRTRAVVVTGDGTQNQVWNWVGEIDFAKTEAAGLYIDVAGATGLTGTLSGIISVKTDAIAGVTETRAGEIADERITESLTDGGEIATYVADNANAGAKGDKGDKGDPGSDGQDGAMGIQGIQGIPGNDGRDGSDGAQGLQGERGIAGRDGAMGIQGEMGLQGEQGIQGNPGIRGERGLPGADGAPGRDGIDGQDGAMGLPGNDGAQGLKGDKGDKGDSGSDGQDGAMGLPGNDGAQGLKGDKGDKGDSGSDGAPGADGAPGRDGRDGTDGIDGAMGIQGERGLQGEQGIQGIQGIPGTSGDGTGGTILPTSAFMVRGNPTQPTQSSTWANISMDSPTFNEGNHFNNGIYTAPETGVYWFNARASINSPQNNTRIDVGLSINGANPLAENSVEGVLSSGTRAPIAEWNGAVSLTKNDTVQIQSQGTEQLIRGSECLFSGFAVPTAQQGLPGEQGIQGEAGQDGERGLQGEMGLQGTPGVNGRDGIDGQDGAMGLPGNDGAQGLKGDKGDKGDSGNDGQDGAPGATGERGLQGIQGIQGIPGNDGSDGAMGLPGNDGLPGAKGDKGDKGDPGSDGQDGAQGMQGNPGIQGATGARGADGRDGATGERGLQGIQGIPGNDGQDGAPGRDGIDGNDGAMGIQGIPGNDGADGNEIDASVLADEGSCAVTGEDTNPAGTSASIPTLTLTCTDPQAPATGRGFLTGLFTIVSDTVFVPTRVTFRSPQGRIYRGTIENDDGITGEIFGRVISGAGTTRQVVEVGIDNTLIWEFSGTFTTINISISGSGITNSTSSFVGKVSVPGSQGILRDRVLELAQESLSGNQLLEIADSEEQSLVVPAEASPQAQSTEAIVPLPLPPISDRFETYTLSLSGVLFGVGAIRVFYSDDNEAIASTTENGNPLQLTGVIDITRPISVGLLGSPVVGVLSGNLTGETRGSLRDQDLLNAQGVVDASLTTALDSGTARFGANGTATGNFTITLPTDTTTEAGAFNAMVRIESSGGSAPDSYTYTTRYSDGDRAVIFGASTITASLASQGFALGAYDVLEGRGIEIVIGVNGGVGNTLTWNAMATIGQGETGDLYQPALDLIQEQIDQIEFPEGYTDEQAKTQATNAINESPIIQANTAKVGLDSGQIADIAKIDGIETKSNNNESAISELQTTTSGLSTSGMATRTIADDNATEIASIKALLPTDTITGIGDLTALTSNIEANEGRITAVEGVNNTQDGRLSALETTNGQQATAISTAQSTANSKTTPTQAKAQAELAITESLSNGGAVATYVADNAGSDYDDTNLSNRITTAQNTANSANNRSGTNQTDISNLTTRLATEETNRNNLANAFNTVRDRSLENESDIGALDTRVGTAEGKITALENATEIFRTSPQEFLRTESLISMKDLVDGKYGGQLINVGSDGEFGRDGTIWALSGLRSTINIPGYLGTETGSSLELRMIIKRGSSGSGFHIERTAPMHSTTLPGRITGITTNDILFSPTTGSSNTWLIQETRNSATNQRTRGVSPNDGFGDKFVKISIIITQGILRFSAGEYGTLAEALAGNYVTAPSQVLTSSFSSFDPGNFTLESFGTTDSLLIYDFQMKSS